MINHSRKKVLAEAIKETYFDIFALRKDAQNFSVEEVKNKLKTLTQGQKSDNVLTLMSNTFKSLCEYADWSDKIVKSDKQEEKKENVKIKVDAEIDKKDKLSLNYNIQIHLPETRDASVYDAIFRSLKEHLKIGE